MPVWKTAWVFLGVRKAVNTPQVIAIIKYTLKHFFFAHTMLRTSYWGCYDRLRPSFSAMARCEQSRDELWDLVNRRSLLSATISGAMWTDVWDLRWIQRAMTSVIDNQLFQSPIAFSCCPSGSLCDYFEMSEQSNGELLFIQKCIDGTSYGQCSC